MSFYGYIGPDSPEQSSTTGNVGVMTMPEHLDTIAKDKLAGGLPPIPSGMTLRFYMDASNYSGSGSSWLDQTGNGRNATVYNPSWTSGPPSYFTMSNNFSFSLPTSSLASDLAMFWVMQTNDVQAVIATSSSSNDYLGAYRSGNKYYHNNVGGGRNLYINATARSNLYDYVRGSTSRLVTISDCDFNFTSQQYKFGNYGSFEFGDGKLYAVGAYNGNLTSANVSTLYDYFNGKGYTGI